MPPEKGQPMAYSIRHRVTLFPQPTSMTCWSAAATMLFGDRSIGPGTASLGSSGGLNSDFDNIEKFAHSHGLTMEAPMSWTVSGLARLMQFGPLWVGGLVPSGHAYVIGALVGDGTPAGTQITIYDPWPPGIGAIRQISYQAWVLRYPMATMYILHH